MPRRWKFSRKCVRTWILRYEVEGEAGMETRSSRPHTMPTRTAPEVEQKVLAARTKHRQSPDLLGPKIGGAAKTVSRILRRHAALPPRVRPDGAGGEVHTRPTNGVRCANVLGRQSKP